MDITELKPAPYNPRRISDQALAGLKKSLHTFGDISGVVFNVRTGHIVAGHQRLRALKEQHGAQATLETQQENGQEIPVGVATPAGYYPIRAVDWDEPTEKLANVAANSGLIAGEFTADLAPLVDELRDAMPSEVLTDLRVDELPAWEGLSTDPEDLATRDEYAASQKYATDSTPFDNPWCALVNMMDVGTGPCCHRCCYCFTRITPASLSWNGTRPKKAKDVTKRIDKAVANTKCVVVGLCNDPVNVEYRAPLVQVFREAKHHGLYVIMQTKNPATILSVAQEEGLPMNQLCMKVSFSAMSEKAAKVIEPGAMSPEHRMDAMERAHNAGASVIFRLQPVIFGLYEGVKEAFERLNGISFRCTVEPVCVNPLGGKYFEPFKHPDVFGPEWTIEKYFDEWGYYVEKKGKRTLVKAGALHWYEYDVKKSAIEYLRLKKWANDNGMQFGICTAERGLPFRKLIDGEYCCQTQHMKDFGVLFDKDSITVRSGAGRMGELVVPGWREHIKDSEWTDRLITRVIWGNDPEYDPVDPALIADAQSELNNELKGGDEYV